MRVVFFGTYDEAAHPRVRVLRDGIDAAAHDVTACNVPLGFDTAARVRLASQPWRLPGFVARLLVAWIRLAWRATRQRTEPDVVVVGYLGVFDVHLARLLFRDSTIVLDQMVTLGGTVRDRSLDGRAAITRLLDRLDRAAARRADLVLVDTPAQLTTVPPGVPVVAVPVGAPTEWYEVEPAPPPRHDDVLRVVFYGLYTPLQGAPVIGRALAALTEDDAVAVTMVGDGQDREATERAAAGSGVTIDWLDWVPSGALPALVASHHVCLGIFATNAKGSSVVPNKVFQGAAAGTAIVTSDSATQRDALGEAAALVPAGDADALAATLRSLAEDHEALASLRARARVWAGQHRPERVAEVLLGALCSDNDGVPGPSRRNSPTNR